MKKLLAVLVLFATLALCFSACKKVKKNDNKPPVSAGPNYELVDKDFEDASFRISMMNGKWFNMEFICDEDSEDPLWSATWTRNQTVQDRYNVSIEEVYYTPKSNPAAWDHVAEAMSMITTGEGHYDLIASYEFTSGMLIMSRSVLDWNQMPYTHLDAPYWIQSINDKFEIDGHTYCATGETNVSALAYTYAMYYNRTRGDALKLTDEILAKIRADEWTIDYFNELVRDVYIDEGNNGIGDDDFYGFRAEALTNLDNYNFAFDLDMVVATDSSDLLECVYNNDKTSEAIDKILDLYWENRGTWIAENSNPEGPLSYFSNDKALFATLTLGCSYEPLTKSDVHYSIFPYPKFDEDQENYHTGMMDNFTVLSVPVDAPDLELSSLITEALNYYAAEMMTPVYYDLALGEKFANDGEETKEMLDLIMNGRLCDMAKLMHRDVNYVDELFRKVVQSKENNFATMYASIATGIDAGLKSIVETYKAAAEGM